MSDKSAMTSENPWAHPAPNTYEFDLEPFTAQTYREGAAFALAAVNASRSPGEWFFKYGPLFVLISAGACIDLLMEIPHGSSVIARMVRVDIDGAALMSGAYFLGVLLVIVAYMSFERGFSRRLLAGSPSLSGPGRATLDERGIRLQFRNFDYQYTWEGFLRDRRIGERWWFTFENAVFFAIRGSKVDAAKGCAELIERHRAQ